MFQGEKNDEAGLYNPYEKVVPRIESVSVWDLFPDPAATAIDDCDFIIQRHRMNRINYAD